jgi:hypothetical protein
MMIDDRRSLPWVQSDQMCMQKTRHARASNTLWQYLQADEAVSRDSLMANLCRDQRALRSVAGPALISLRLAPPRSTRARHGWKGGRA